MGTGTRVDRSYAKALAGSDLSMRVSETPEGLVDLIQHLIVRVDSFRSLTARSKGAWPVHLLDALCVVKTKGDDLAKRASILIAEAAIRTTDKAYLPSHDPRLPLPHPLDSDWRFDRLTKLGLLKALLAASDEDKILLVGMPTIVLAAADAGVDHRIVHAVRDGDPVAEALADLAPRATAIPIEDFPKRPIAACAAVDPPWYDDVGVPMVERAIAGTIPGGTVFICGPDEMTGASAASALKGIQAKGAQFGLADVKRVARTRYETPLFEMMALGELGVHSVHPQWRTGLVHCGIRFAVNMVPGPMPQNPGWQEIVIGTCRIRVRSISSCTELVPDSPLSVLPSVSRTHSSRAAANVVTSGNAAGVIPMLSVSTPSSIEAFLKAFADSETAVAERLLLPEPPLRSEVGHSQANNGLA